MELAELIEKSRVDNVILRRGPRPQQPGSLALIGHHLIFSATPKPGEKHSHDDELWLLHRAIDRVTVEPIVKGPNPPPNSGALLTLKCKNFMICVFEITNINDCSAVARSIEILSNLNNRDLDYPFYYRCPFKVLDNGWNIFDIELEFTKVIGSFPDRFRITSVNEGFGVCPSYPEKVIVPKGIGDDYLRIAATFRDGGRFPVLSFVDYRSKSIVVRTSQPLIGPTNRRCTEDEVIFSSYLGNTTKGFIFDTRSKSLLASAKSRGGGSEPPFCYRAWSYVNLSLPRIQELQESLTKLIEACNENDVNFLSKLNASSWLTHVSSIINASGVLAQSIKIHNRGATHIVHGSEGTDMTLILTSIAEFILNPECRTIRGFQTLVEREWLSGGHPFALRCAHSAYASGRMTGPYESPVFLCFLDCIWQISHVYPTSLEFNEQFLIYLFEHTYASEFGTFLCNNDKERKDLNVREKTVSLWSHINHPDILNGFINPLFCPFEGDVWPVSAAQSILLWDRMYFRWRMNWNDIDEKMQTISQWAAREKELQSKLAQLLNQRVTLENSIVDKLDAYEKYPSNFSQYSSKKSPMTGINYNNDSSPELTCGAKVKRFFRKYFLEGQKLENALELKIRQMEGNLPWHEKYRKYIAFLIPFVFWHCIWWSLAIRYNFFRLYPTRYEMAVTMVLGATVAGATSEGGGAVAFPVMTLLLHLDSKVARDFSLMIQSCGMTSASFAILYMGVQVEWHAVIFSSLGATISIIVGLQFVDDILTGQQKKMLFVSIWFSFAVSLFLLNRQARRTTYLKIQNFSWRRASILFFTGLVGGLCSAFAGSGVDICTFSILTLLFQISEKIATPTSVILMAINTAVGFYWRHAIMSDVSQLAWEYFEVAIPVVVFCAPFGAFLSSHCHRKVLASFVYILEAAALIGFLITRPPFSLILVGAGIIVFSFFFFLFIMRMGKKMHNLETAELVPMETPKCTPIAA